QSKEIAHGRRNIEASTFVEIKFRPFISENVLPVIGAEWSCIFPLRVRNAVAFADSDPMTFTGGNRGALIRLVKRRNNARFFTAMSLPCFSVNWKRKIKRIAFWRKINGHIVVSARGIRFVHAAVVFGPVFVPLARSIGHWIVAGGFLADPEDGR